MKQTITTTVPHTLGQSEAHRRLQAGFAHLGEKSTTSFGVFSMKHQWVDDEQLTFDGSAMGQSINGRISVSADFIRIEVDVPPMLTAVAKIFMNGVKKKTTKLLGKP